MNSKINVAVITGGKAAELEVSLKSAQVVIDNLDKNKYNVYRIDITSLPWKAKDLNQNEFTIDLNGFILEENKLKFDVAFIAIHGMPAENGQLQGYLDLMKIPYASAGVLGSAITFDKDTTKQLASETGVLLAQSVLISKQDFNLDKIKSKLSLPIFVKPNKNGSSYGISKVKDFAELEKAVNEALKFDDEVLVEEFIEGRELASGVVETPNGLVCLPITEIKTENEFFDYEAKYLGKSKEITPAPITDNQKQRIFSFTKKIFTKMKLKGFSRVDYFLKGDDIYLLEVNTIPGLSQESILPQQAIAYGYTLPQFFDIIISNTISK